MKVNDVIILYHINWALVRSNNKNSKRIKCKIISIKDECLFLIPMEAHNFFPGPFNTLESKNKFHKLTDGYLSKSDYLKYMNNICLHILDSDTEYYSLIKDQSVRCRK